MANKTTLKDNEFILVLPNRSGQDGFDKEGFTEFVYTQISIIASMDMQVPVSQTFTNGVVEPVTVYDNITIQSSDDLVANTGADTITVKKDGIYKLSGGISVAFPGAELLAFSWYINNAPLFPNPVQLRGEGVTNPITVSWETITDLKADDVVTIQGTNLQPGTLSADFKAVYFTVRRIG